MSEVELPTKKVHISWKAIEEAVELLRRDMTQATPPKLIVALERGGIIPGVLLHRFFPNATFKLINPKDSVDDIDWTINEIIEEGLEPAEVWVIDEVYDSGATLERLHTPPTMQDINYGVLWSKRPTTPSWVRYAFWADPSIWLVFPWELEDRPHQREYFDHGRA